MKGDVQYEKQWGCLYKMDCELYKLKNECKEICKHRSPCKLYVMKTEEGIVKVKRMNVNARLPSKGTKGSAGYDLAATQSAVVPAHGKCLVQTGLAISLPPGCYGRIAPRSGLAIKKFIDVGAGVIDADYRGELGVILFNFGEEDFIVNMGERIAQLIFEKIKTPQIKEVKSLEETRRGNRGYGSTGMNEGSKTNDDDKSSVSVVSVDKPQEDQKSRHQMKTIPDKERSRIE